MPEVESLQELKGEQVSGICFVMDYVEVHFNGAILRCLADPILEMAHERIKFPSEGARDALCSLIGLAVEHAIVRGDSSVEVCFSGGARLIVPLNEGTDEMPEAVHFVVPRSGLMKIW